MLDNRLITFLSLCEIMNYRKTAEYLNMTQPAVTQHIHYLENEYNCKLFIYNGKKLYKTEKCLMLEQYARSAKHNATDIKTRLSTDMNKSIKIGATKTIGDYVVTNDIFKIAADKSLNFTFIIDNTKHLLDMLNHSEIDIALIEGYFDKNQYDYKKYKKEKYVGICSNDHPFANKQVSISDTLKESIIIREEGSGTREILEQILFENSFTVDSYKHCVTTNSFDLISKLVQDNYGISFVYESIAKNNKNLSTFTFKDTEVFRDFNFVYLKDTYSSSLISYFS